MYIGIMHVCDKQTDSCLHLLLLLHTSTAILDGNNTIRVVSPTVTGIEHRKIEPKAKHFSHGKKDRSSRPNRTDNSKRLAKITQSYKRIRRRFNYYPQINLIINPQFIESRQTHAKRDYIKQISTREGENIVLRSKKREEANQLITMDPKGLW